ncbi:MAG TPA: hypothetical protein VMU13_03730, partial [Candidatus Paceibacterota bacterium]|nr:hypothetical protein [Candidatus Paceibacterota bacterium]
GSNDAYSHYLRIISELNVLYVSSADRGITIGDFFGQIWHSQDFSEEESRITRLVEPGRYVYFPFRGADADSTDYRLQEGVEIRVIEIKSDFSKKWIRDMDDAFRIHFEIPIKGGAPRRGHMRLCDFLKPQIIGNRRWPAFLRIVEDASDCRYSTAKLISMTC